MRGVFILKEIYSATIFSGIVLIILILIIVHFLTKSRKHKDFYLVMIVSVFFGLCAIYLFATGIIDIISFKTGDFHTTEGICEIAYFEESSSGRGSHPSYYNVHINGLNLTADGDEFSFLKEENISCKTTYLKATETLIDIKLNK